MTRTPQCADCTPEALSGQGSRRHHDPGQLTAYGLRLTAGRGFTILEALVVLGIATIIGIAALTLQKDVFSVSSLVSGNLTAQFQIRNALKQMTTYIRMANTANDGSYAVAAADGAEFAFYSDIDNDTVRERVRYFVDGGTLKTGVIEPAGDPLTYAEEDEILTDLVDDIVNLTSVFSYYDSQYDGESAPLAEPIEIPDVRLVGITLHVDRYGGLRPGGISFSSLVMMRNLKTGL